MQDYFTQIIIKELFQKAWQFYREIPVNKTSFTLTDCGKLADEITATTGYVISARSYFNLYKDEGAKNDSSLEAICAYLLIKHHLLQPKDLEFRIIDTKIKVNEVSQKPPSGVYSLLYYKHFLIDNSDENIHAINEPITPEVDKISHTKKYLIAGFAMFILLLGFNWYQKNYFSKTEIETFNTLIRNANDTELQIYRKLPKIDTLKLDDYFIKRGMAKGLITSTVKRMFKYNLSLVIAPSSYRILNIECKSKTDTSVMVETREYWYLRWANRFTNIDTLLYDVENVQLYQLLREDNKWKIDMNKYSGKAKKLDK